MPSETASKTPAAGTGPVGGADLHFQPAAGGAVIRSASALAAVPGPGRFRGQEVTMVHCLSLEIKPELPVRLWPLSRLLPVAAMPAVVRNLRRSIYHPLDRIPLVTDEAACFPY